jgi:hypothetical protein
MYLTTAYEWSVTKSGPATSISIQQGSSGTASYTVAFTRTTTDIPMYTVSSTAVLGVQHLAREQLTRQCRIALRSAPHCSAVVAAVVAL